MTKLLLKIFIKDYENVQNGKVREKYGVLSGAVGIFCNVLLTIAKFIIGTVTNSIAITADAVNNLSDAASSGITLLSFKAANKPADDDHPFGHGRIEYISALAVAFIVLLMGIELIKSSIDKILHPEALAFSWPALIVLLLSICVKLWMAFFNRSLGRKINSPAMTAVVMDSVSDTAATSVSMIALILSKFTAVPLDGYMGIIVALFIVYTGISIIKETAGMLMGETPDPELVKELEQEILSYEGVIGVHDLMVHNYGPNRIFASAHAEVSASADIMESHDTIDCIERDVMKKFKLQLVLHMDPIVIDDENINRLRMETNNIIKEINEELSMHDFRAVPGPTHTNLIFDIVVPFNLPQSKKELSDAVSKAVREKLGDNYYTVVTVEHSYVGI